VLATTTLGQVWHAFRGPDKKWSAFGSVSAVVGSNAFYRDVDGTVDDDGHLHVVATGQGFQHHTTRNRQNGAWQPFFGDIASVAGDPGNERRGAAQAKDNNLHVYVTTSAGGLFGTVRDALGAWQPYVNAKGGSAELMLDVAIAHNKHSQSLFFP
jgi:hypothetical protein